MADLVTIDGHQYYQTNEGLIGADSVPTVTPAIKSKILNLIQLLKSGNATAIQQQQALALILAFQLGLLDLP